MKDGETKNIVLLKDELKELSQSYPNIFNTFVKNELEQPAAKKENIDYKKLSQEIFSYGFNFLAIYGTPYKFLKTLATNRVSINGANDNQRDLVFNLMKGYNASNFIKGSKDLAKRNLYEKRKSKAIEILLECQESVEGIKTFLPKRFNKDITEDQRSILLNAIKLFDIRNIIVSLFRNAGL